MMRAAALSAALVLALGGAAAADLPPACADGPEPPCLIALAEAELAAPVLPERALAGYELVFTLRARLGQIAEARALLDGIADQVTAEIARADLALALARAGHAEDALDVALGIPSTNRRIDTLTGLGRTGDPALSPDRILTLVAEIVGREPPGIGRDVALLSQGRAWAYLGSPENARARLSEIEVDFYKARLRLALAEAEGLAGDPVAAMAAVADLDGFDRAQVVLFLLERRTDDAALAAMEGELARLDDPLLAYQYRLHAAHLLERAGRADVAGAWLDGTRDQIGALPDDPDADAYRLAFADVALRLGREADARDGRRRDRTPYRAGRAGDRRRPHPAPGAGAGRDPGPARRAAPSGRAGHAGRAKPLRRYLTRGT